jgi:hypothetical protein
MKMSYSNNRPLSPASKTRTLDAHKQRALDKLAGHSDMPRRPLTDYEYTYEIASDGALYSIRLQRFLKPVYNHEKNAAELEFEFEGELIRMSPGKAVALSFFSPIQRERIADEAYDIQAFETFHEVKGHPGIEKLAYKYDLSEGAIFYILLAAVARALPPGTSQKEAETRNSAKAQPTEVAPSRRTSRGYQREENPAERETPVRPGRRTGR